MGLEDTLYPLLRFYERLPDGVSRLAAQVYRSLPDAIRYGKSHAQFVELAGNGATWSLTQIREYQVQQLQLVLLHAASFCPFYRRHFARVGFNPERLKDPGDLRSCPAIEKSDLLHFLPEFVSTSIPRAKRLYMTTGGSTGVPVGFYLHKEVSRPKEHAFIKAMWSRAGYSERARLVVIRGGVTSSAASGRIWRYDGLRDWLIVSSYHLTHERMPEVLLTIERFKPDFLHAYPSAALQMAEYLEAHGQSWRVPLKALLCGSERLTTPQRRLLERVFGCRVYSWYGHAERVLLAGQGARTELFYFFPQYGFVEFGPPDADGLRELIGTSFHNLVMPLIRYRTGDYVRLADEETSDFEFPWSAATEIVGREHEFLVSGTGRKISLTAFNMHDDVFDGLYAVQFYQEEAGLAEFRYVAGPDFHSSRLIQIEKQVRKKLGDDFQVRFRAVKDVERSPNGKHRWLVSRLTAAREQKCAR